MREKQDIRYALATVGMVLAAGAVVLVAAVALQKLILWMVGL